MNASKNTVRLTALQDFPNRGVKKGETFEATEQEKIDLTRKPARAVEAAADVVKTKVK